MGLSKVWIRRDYERCSGCRRCEIACSLSHEGLIWPEASRIRVFMLVPGVEVPHLCFQCEDYPCVDACPMGALSINSETGAVETDSSKCSACGLCIEACPGKVPHLHPKGNPIVICDLCGGKPKCVEACQEGEWEALKLVEKRRDFSYGALAKTPREITIETAKKILPKSSLKEVIDT
ncbi:4Fe-4S dicluster domain-containing protein [Candidatus Bathyarchaeota archaeon]|nr:4Fe-4S dicluster domain-containing protein [Candidatus Bathyarchaeota archaeon]